MYVYEKQQQCNIFGSSGPACSLVWCLCMGIYVSITRYPFAFRRVDDDGDEKHIAKLQQKLSQVFYHFLCGKCL